jgi:hypothetical protein
VRDGSPGMKALAERFLESLLVAGGSSAGLEPGAQFIDARQPGALAQLRRDVDWAGPQVLAVFSEPGSPLARAVRSSPWPAVLTLAWPLAELEPLANPQLGVDPGGRGEGWPAFGRPAGGRARCVGSEEGESQGISTDRRFLTVSQQMASTEPI